MGINLVSLSGNLTRDPEIRETQGGMAILTFGMAVNDRRKNPQTGEWEEVPNFVDCTVFGSRANALMPYLSKGAKVAVQGKLHYSSWEKDGQRRSKLEVIVDEIEFLSPRKEQGGQRQAPQQQYAAPGQQFTAPAAQMPQQTFYPNQAPLPQQQVPQMDVYDQDIPF